MSLNFTENLFHSLNVEATLTTSNISTPHNIDALIDSEQLIRKLFIQWTLPHVAVRVKRLNYHEKSPSSWWRQHRTNERKKTAFNSDKYARSHIWIVDITLWYFNYCRKVMARGRHEHRCVYAIRNWNTQTRIDNKHSFKYFRTSKSWYIGINR